MVWSRYNILFEREGAYLFYNSLSNAFVELSKELYGLLSAFKAGDAVSSIDKDLEDNLVRMKALVQDDDTEMLKIKYQSVARRFDNRFVNLTINPTLGCNFACPYCFEGEHKNIFMSEEVEDGIMDFIKRKEGAKRIDVTWFGGEPLLGFPRIVSLTRKIQSLGLPYRAGMITNGYLLDMKVASQLEQLDMKYVQITIDGLREDHDKWRFLKNGGPTFERIAENIDTISKTAPSVRVNIRVNIDAGNTDKFVTVFDCFYRKQYANVVVTPAFVENQTGDYGCAFSGREQLDFIVRLFREHGMNFKSFYPSYARAECSVRNKNVVVIGPEGEVYKCWNDVGRQDRVVGDIWGHTSNERLLLQYLAGADPFDDIECKKCVLLPVCSGGCPYKRITNHGKPCGKGDACPLVKLEIEAHLWMHYQYKRKSAHAMANVAAS